MQNQSKGNNTYDLTPYPGAANAATLPHRMAVVGQLFGVKSPDARKCRVLELGCAAGQNLIPMAEMLPECRFVGIDYSDRQISEGLAMISELGLTNIELRRGDIVELAQQRNQFDYIISHGIYSWVPAEVRDALLKICREQLAPDGIAYVSYNTLPGWRSWSIIRDAMQYRAARGNSPAEQAKMGREFVKFLAEAVPSTDVYGHLLKDLIRQMKAYPDEYLIHDHLETVNHPVYFHEFVAHAGRHGLAYLGESRIVLMWPEIFAPGVTASLRKLTSDPIEMEQYMDFLRNQSFHCTLLCHQEKQVDRKLLPRRLDGLFISAKVTSEAPPAEMPASARSFKVGNFKLNLDNPAVIAVLEELAGAGPEGMPFLELIDRAKLPPDAADVVGKQLLYLYLKEEIDLLSAEPACVPLTERPRGRRRTEFQIKTGRVVNLLHKNILLTATESLVMTMLDGTHDRQFVTTELIRMSRAGTLPCTSPETPAEHVVERMPDLVDQVLRTLASHALLVA